MGSLYQYSHLNFLRMVIQERLHCIQQCPSRIRNIVHQHHHLPIDVGFRHGNLNRGVCRPALVEFNMCQYNSGGNNFLELIMQMHGQGVPFGIMTNAGYDNFRLVVVVFRNFESEPFNLLLHQRPVGNSGVLFIHLIAKLSVVLGTSSQSCALPGYSCHLPAPSAEFAPCPTTHFAAIAGDR